MSDLKPASNLDPNAWYHLTEGRVDDYDKKNFGGMLQIDGKGVFYVFAADKNQYFQFVSLLPAPLPLLPHHMARVWARIRQFPMPLAYLGPLRGRTTKEIVYASSMGGLTRCTALATRRRQARALPDPRLQDGHQPAARRLPRRGRDRLGQDAPLHARPGRQRRAEVGRGQLGQQHVPLRQRPQRHRLPPRRPPGLRRLPQLKHRHKGLPARPALAHDQRKGGQRRRLQHRLLRRTFNS